VYSLLLSALLAVSTSQIQLSGTPRLPGAHGLTKVVKGDGTAKLIVELNGVKPATLFGGDYNTYVLWLVSRDGQPVNAGQIALDGDQGRLQTSTDLSNFGIFVTAEPHYAVDRPSRFVILTAAKDTHLPQYECATRGVAYNYERNTLAYTKHAAGPVHTEVQQAFMAVRLAERAGAGTLAPQQLAEARSSLQRTLDVFQEKKPFETVQALAHETIELAVQAQRAAEHRATASAK